MREAAVRRFCAERLAGANALEDAPEVLRFYRELIAAAPDELTTIFELSVAPPLPFLPERCMASRS